MLTKRVINTFLRRLAAAPEHELTEALAECRTTAADTSQANDVRLAARSICNVARSMLRERRK